MPSWMSTSLLLLANLYLTACGGLTATDRSASLTVTNLSDIPMCGVYLGREHQADRNHNRLRDAAPILPEMERTFFVTAGRWNVRIEDCGGTTLYGRRAMPIRGTARIDFRPVEVQRVPGRSTRRYAAPRLPPRLSF